MAPAESAPPTPPGPEPSVPAAGSTPAPGGSGAWGGWLSGGASARATRREERQARRDARRAERGIGGAMWGILLVLIGLGLLGSELIPSFDWDLAWPAALVAFGILLVAASIRRTPTDT
jgi:hypothetical protein